MTAVSGAFSRYRIILGLVITVCVSALVGVGCGGGSSVSSINLQNTLSGRILADRNPASIRTATALLGVAGAQVWIEDLADDPQFHTITGERGAYEFHGVPEGAHRVVAKYTDNAGVVKNRSYVAHVPVGAETTVVETVILEPAKNVVTGVLRDMSGNVLPAGTLLTLWGEPFTVGSNGIFTSPPLPDAVSQEIIFVKTGTAGVPVSIVAPFVSSVVPAFLDLRVNTAGAGENHPPSGALIASGESGITSRVSPGGLLSLSVTGYDADAGEAERLTYQWSTTLGTLENGTSPMRKTWRAPAYTGVATISVQITDPDGATGTVKLPLLIGITSPSQADLTPPTTTLAALVAETFDNEAFQVRIAFSEAVTGFGAGDLKVTNGSVTGLAQVTAGTIYTATIKPAAIGNVKVELPAAVAADIGGNLALAAVAITVSNTWSDLVPPAEPTINAVTTPTNGSPQTISGTKPADAATVLVNGSSDGVTYPTATTWRYALALQPGTNAISVVSRDAAGNVSNAMTSGIEYDNVAPTAPTAVTLAPVGGTIVANTLNSTNTNLTVSAAIVAGQATGGEAELLFNGASLVPAVKDAAIAAGDTTVTFDVGLAGNAAVRAKFPAGGVFSVRLRDPAGSAVVSTAGNPTLFVDYVAPVVSAPINTAQTLKNGAVSTSTVRSSEAGSIYFVKNGVAAATPAQIAVAVAANLAFAAKTGAVANTPYPVTLPLTLVEGLYDLVAVDTAGNVSAIVGGWLTVDNTKPVVSAPTNVAQTLKSGATSTSTVQSTEAGNIYLVKHLEAATTQTGIDTAVAAHKAFLAKNGAVANTPYPVTLNAGLLDGLYDLVAVDIAGNISTIVGGWLTVDNTKPVVSAPTNVAQTLKSGDASTSTVRSTEAGRIYLVKHLEPATTQGEIDTAISAHKAFLAKDAAAANTAYPVTLAAGLLDGVYDIVAVDIAGNVSAILGGWLMVDNTPPTALAVTSTTASNGVILDDIVNVTIRFSEPVRVVTTGGTPALTLETGSTDRAAPWQSGDTTDSLVFRYTVQNGDFSSDLDYANTTALALNGGTIGDAVGNPAVLTLPAPGAAGSLGANAQIAVDAVTAYAFGGHLGDARNAWWNGTRLSGSFGAAAVSPDGSIFVSDVSNHRVFKLSSAGAVTKIIGGPGAGNGQFNGPRGIAFDSSGNVYVADSGNDRIQKFDSDGTFLAAWGSTGTGDGQFDEPWGIAIDGSDNVYIADYTNGRVQKFTSALVFSSKFNVSQPKGICFDGAGNLCFVSGNIVMKYTPAGSFITQWGTNGTGNGQFISPEGIARANSGNILVADAGNDRLQEFTNAGAFVSVIGSFGTGNGQFDTPKGVCVDGTGKIFVADTGNGRIQRLSALGVFEARWGTAGAENGRFNNPYDVARDLSGNVYISDFVNNRIQKFSSTGAYITQWGTGGTGNGNFSGPKGIAVDDSGNVYVADSDNDRIQKFTGAGVFVAKWGTSGAQAGNFNDPCGVAVDASGNLYVADSGNHRMQKFSSAGAVLAVWGSNGAGDGQFANPRGVAVDWAGNIYVADAGNHRIQKFDASRAFVAKWGTNGTAAGQFAGPKGIAVDVAGNVYVSDTGNDRIQKFTPSGTWMAGWNSTGSADGQFLGPIGLVVDETGSILVADGGNHTIEAFLH
ncbi:hypothetical protein KBA41_11015 [Candidatus Ozemobacteraceae bacterium]|nr:hypothetical protein [Candidatus Ozemobacteraceae bacterium]